MKITEKGRKFHVDSELVGACFGIVGVLGIMATGIGMLVGLERSDVKALSDYNKQLKDQYGYDFFTDYYELNKSTHIGFRSLYMAIGYFQRVEHCSFEEALERVAHNEVLDKEVDKHIKKDFRKSLGYKELGDGVNEVTFQYWSPESVPNPQYYFDKKAPQYKTTLVKKWGKIKVYDYDKAFSMNGYTFINESKLFNRIMNETLRG